MLTAYSKMCFLFSRSADNNGEAETNVKLRVKRKIEDYPNFLTKRQKLLNDYR